ncbi:MAG: phage virion morphogenesis protein [Paracoccus sp. (in: a-proteobacteria)]
MSAVSFEVQIEDADARARLQKMLGRMDSRKPFFSTVGQLLADSTRERFRTGRDPAGAAWVPLSHSTLKARARRGHSAISILRERGFLAGSIRFEASEDRVKVGSVLEDYAAIHQLGGTIDMPARKQTLRFKAAETGNGRRFAKKKEKAINTQEVLRRAHKIVIPARPYLGVSRADEADIFSAAERWLTV